MPEVPKLNTCCVLFNLEIGTKIIAWICTILGALETLGYLLQLIPNLGKDGTLDTAFALVLAALFTLLGVYLLLGVYKGNQSYVRLWVQVAFIYIIILLILIIFRIARWVTGHASGDIFVQIISWLFIVYFVLVVNSFLKEQGATGVEGF